MSYSMVCGSATIINTVANIGFSYVNRFNSNTTLQGGALFGAIAGVTYSVIVSGTYKFLDLILDEKCLTNKEIEMRKFLIVVGTISISALVTAICAPTIASCLGLQISYKTGAAYSYFNMATTLLVGSIFANI